MPINGQSTRAPASRPLRREGLDREMRDIDIVASFKSESSDKPCISGNRRIGRSGELTEDTKHRRDSDAATTDNAERPLGSTPRVLLAPVVVREGSQRCVGVKDLHICENSLRKRKGTAETTRLTLWMLGG
jgi:hypothetical protein